MITDIELQELKDKVKALENKIRKSASENDELYHDMYDIQDKIKAEEEERYNKRNFDAFYKQAKAIMDSYSTNVYKTKSKPIWIIEINGKRYSSDKSKSTWTSKNKAYDALSWLLHEKIYLYGIGGYNRDYNMHTRPIIDKLIEDGIVEIKQVL